MSLGFSRFGLSFVAAAFAASNLLVSNGIAQGNAQPRRSIELTETNSAEILTNLNQLSTKKDEFRQLDEQLRTLRGLSSPKSMEQRFSVPYGGQGAMPKKRIKDLMERQKNWGFTAEDINQSASSSDSEVSSFEGTDKFDPKSSSVQQFYNTLNGQGSSAPNQNRSTNEKSPSNKRSIFTPENSSEDDSSLPPEIRDKTQRLKELVNGDPTSIFNQTRPRTDFENFFGKSERRPTEDQATGTKATIWIEQFKKGLDPSVAAGMDPTLGGLAPETGQARKTLSPELSKLPTSTHHDAPDPTPARINSVLDVTAVSDINAAVLNQWNPLYTIPKAPLPKKTPPTPINLDFPRRKF